MQSGGWERCIDSAILKVLILDSEVLTEEEDSGGLQLPKTITTTQSYTITLHIKRKSFKNLCSKFHALTKKPVDPKLLLVNTYL